MGMWDVIERIIYVGGDVDTVGAVAGQLIGPMLTATEMCCSFRRYVGLDWMHLSRASPQGKVAGAAARRFFHRAVLFAGGQWQDLLNKRSLTDPVYEGLT